jgi:hypothetical protein
VQGLEAEAEGVGDIELGEQALVAGERGEEIFEEFPASYDAGKNSGDVKSTENSLRETLQQQDLKHILHKEPLRETV